MAKIPHSVHHYLRFSLVWIWHFQSYVTRGRQILALASDESSEEACELSVMECVGLSGNKITREGCVCVCMCASPEFSPPPTFATVPPHCLHLQPLAASLCSSGSGLRLSLGACVCCPCSLEPSSLDIHRAVFLSVRPSLTIPCKIVPLNSFHVCALLFRETW